RVTVFAIDSGERCSNFVIKSILILDGFHTKNKTIPKRIVTKLIINTVLNPCHIFNEILSPCCIGKIICWIISFIKPGKQPNRRPNTPNNNGGNHIKTERGRSVSSSAKRLPTKGLIPAKYPAQAN